MRRSIAICVVACAAGIARADDTHYQDFVVGGRAVVLGGAYTSLADDPSGVYYNPAGIADVSHTSLSLTASLYGFERGVDEKLGFLGVPGVEDLKVQFTDLIVVPASAGFVKTLGEPGVDGRPRHAYGVSIIVPSLRSFTVVTSNESEAGSAIYKRRVTDRELWSGVGYGTKIGKRLRLGVSVFYIFRSLIDLEDVTSQQRLAADAGVSFDSVVNDITLTTGSVVVMAGAKYRVWDRLTIGAAIQSPSVQLHSQASLRFTRLSSDPSVEPEPFSSFDQLIIDDADSQMRWAPRLRIGAHFTRKYRYTLSVDASFHAPVDYTLVKVDARYKDRLPFNPAVERRFVANVNLGIEYLVVREVSVALGLFSDFSSAPPIPKQPRVDQPPRVNLLGMTGGLGYFGKHSLSRIGVVYSFGRGQDVIPESSIDRVLHQEQAFQRIEYAQSFFYVFVSSTFRY